MRRSKYLRLVVGLALVTGTVAGLAGVINTAAEDAQRARIQRFDALLKSQNLPNFTLVQQAAMARMRQHALRPAWSELSASEKLVRVARFAQQTFAASTPTAAVPTAAAFLGNQTAIAFAHTGANGFVLYRQSDCSLTEAQGSYTFGSVSTSALTLSPVMSTIPHFEQFLHNAAGLTTTAGSFAAGCKDSSAGTGSVRSVYLGKTTAGLLIGVGTGYFPPAGVNALYYGIADPSGSAAATVKTDISIPGLDSVAAGDLNGDGLLDVIGVDSLHGQIAVWIANADGSLQAPVTYALPGTTTESAVVGDCNGDGKADVVAVSRDVGGGEHVSLLAGSGNGVLAAAQSFTVVTPSSGLTSVYLGTLIAVDLRHTGHLDVVAANGSVLLNDGSGNFTPGVAAFPALSGNSEFGPNLTSGDFNKDGVPDLAVNTGNLIRIAIGNGDGTFTAGASYASVDNVGYMAAADLDGDGNLDLWSGSSGGGVFAGDQYGVETANALMGNGDGTFQSAPSLPFVYTGTNLADLNADGVRDAVGVNADLSLTPYLGTAAGKFTAGTALVTTPVMIAGSSVVLSNIDSLSLGDVTGDGSVDVIYSGTEPGAVNHLFLARGDGHAGFLAPTAIAQPTLAGAGDTDNGESISNVRLADVNGDGKLDLVYAYTDQGSPSGTYLVGNAVQLGNGDGTFQAPKQIPFYSGATPIFYGSKVALIADVNADGKLDLILLSQQSTINSMISTYPAQIQVALGHGDGTFAAPATVAGPDLMGASLGAQYAPIVLADMNGDGKLDLVAAGSSSTSNPQIAVALGNGDGTFQAPILKTYSGQYIGQLGLGVADFDGDGKADVVMTNPYSLFASGIALGNGDGSLQETGDPSNQLTYVNYNFALTVGGPTLIYDMNGDGKLDILVGSTQLFGQAAVSSSGGGGTTSPSPNFVLTASAAAGTVGAGASATATLTVTPSNGFTQAVALSCTGLPTGASCNFAPATVTPSGAAATSILTITTTARMALNSMPDRDPRLPAGMLFAAFGALVVKRRRVGSRSAAPLAALFTVLLLAACGGDHVLPTNGGSAGGGASGTAAGTYMVTITATAGATVHTVSYALTVT